MDCVQQLATSGIQHVKDILCEADGKSGELLTALKFINRHVEIIRTRRDALYMLLLEWKDAIASFETLPNARTPRTDRAVNGLYRLLARRYVTAQNMFNGRGRR